jgi:hypothetical protein
MKPMRGKGNFKSLSRREGNGGGWVGAKQKSMLASAYRRYIMYMRAYLLTIAAQFAHYYYY